MIIYNYYFAIFILALIFFLISNKNPSILIAIIIIIIIGYYYYNFIVDYNNKLENNFKNQIAKLEKDINTNNNENNVIQYLNHDKEMINFLFNIRFIKIFDAHKFSNIIVLFEKLVKLYIFMLGDRYNMNNYFSTFMYTRTKIFKELYSAYLITPIKRLKFIHNLNPYNEIKKTIEDFKKHTRKMIIILEKYAYQKKGIYYLDDTKYKPFENNDNLDVY